MDYGAFLTRIIEDGIAEVREAYAGSEPRNVAKRAGAIEGFDACRGKTPAEIAALMQETTQAASRLVGTDDIDGYWQVRYKALQVEWVANCVSAVLMNQGHPPLASHLPTCRAAMKAAEVVGVKE